MKKKPPAPASNAKKRPAKSTAWLWVLFFLALAVSLGIWFVLTRQPPQPTKRVFPEETLAWDKTRAEKDLVFGGLPKFTTPRSDLLVLRNQAFVSGYCEEFKNPLWVSYRVDQAFSASAPKRPPRFLVDSRTRSRINQNAYKNSGYDRGHMAPNFAIASRYGPLAQGETFLMTNIVPQKPDLNRKLWEKLERLEVDYSNRHLKIWVMVGPIFDDDRQTMNSGIEIPDAFYKILLDEQENTRELRFLSFLIPQSVRGNEPLQQFLTSVDEIERQTGLDFFWALNDPHEEFLEGQVPKALW